MEQRLQQFKQEIIRWRDRTIHVGFSGGADSTALLLLLDRCMEELHLRLRAVHFEHGLRPESEDDARWCEDFCRTRYIDFLCVPLAVPKHRYPGEGIEAAARRLRLEAWSGIVEYGGIVALGHHAGDRIENALLRLCRGANVSGVTSMRAVQSMGSFRLIRPLLNWKKEEIEQFLSDAQVSSWREDASNRSPVYKRNYFRHDILPRIYQGIPAARGGIMRALEAMESDAAFIEEAATRHYQALPTHDFLPLSLVRRLHPALVVRVLRLWLSEQIGVDTIPDHNLLNRVIQAAASIHSKSGETHLIPFRRDLQLAVRHDRLTVQEPNRPGVFGEVEWNWCNQEEVNFGPHLLRAEILPAARPATFGKTSPFSTVFAAGSLPERLIVRSWRDGDRVIMPGHTRPVKLKKVFSERKIKAADKKHYAVVTSLSGEILWVAGMPRPKTPFPPELDVVRLTFVPAEKI